MKQGFGNLFAIGIQRALTYGDFFVMSVKVKHTGSILFKYENISVHIPHADPEPEPPTALSVHDVQVELLPEQVRQLGSHTVTKIVVECVGSDSSKQFVLIEIKRQ